MSQRNLDERIGRLRSQLGELLACAPLRITDAVRNAAMKTVQGVYALSIPDDSEIVYVGRTKTKSIAGRISDHRSIDTASDLKGMLARTTELPPDVNSYLVRYTQMEDGRERLFFEAFAIGVLAPRFNK